MTEAKGQRERERMRREDVILLALKTEEGDTSEGMHGL